jgi:hypothetical protein
MASEQEWVELLRPTIQGFFSEQPEIFVKTGFRLPYSLQVEKYLDTGVQNPQTSTRVYQTDLLIGESLGDTKEWFPRVVVEFKIGSVTTHDALTYSAKAATHKNVHPYLRYGIIIGERARTVPGRLIRHGQQFDFMMSLPPGPLGLAELNRLSELLRDEIRASQEIGRLMLERSNVRLTHRKWIVS